MQRFNKNKKIGLAVVFSILFYSASASAADEEGMFLDLKINQVQRGAFAVYRSPDGDFFVRLSDLAELGLKRDISLPRVRIMGESGSFVSLRDLGAVRMEMDNSQLTLNVELPPDVFEKTSIDADAKEARLLLGSERSSGFVNYRLTDTTYGAATSSRYLATELGLRYGGVLLLNLSQFREDGGTSRYLTQLVFDRPEDQQRFIAGDFTGSSGELGSALPMGGLNFSKVFSMDPDLIRQPLAGFSGVATSPSQVEVRVGGVPVAYSQVAAGPFELQNLRQYGGASDVQVVVRDALGREQVYNFPFYFAEQSLRTGLHEYSYSFGKLRTNIGLPGDTYGTEAFSAFHRYGYSDALTLGARAEAAQDLSNVGLGATWRSNQLGVLAASVSGSSYKGLSGDAAMLSYSYRLPQLAWGAIARRFSSGYAPLETLVNGFNRSAEYGGNVSWYPGPGASLGLSHTLTQTRNLGSARVTSLNYAQSLGPSSFLYATLQRSQDDVLNAVNTSLFVGWTYRFGGKYTASVSASRDEAGQQSIYTQVARDIPYGEGIGYRVGWTGTEPPPTDHFNGYVQWNLPALSLSLDANTVPSLNGNADYREIAAAGSVAFAGSSWGFSRQINDSFAIVQMGAPVPGVHVLSNSLEVGTSDTNGQTISPFLGSFYESQISIDDQSVPLQYVMGKNSYNIRPAYRSGVDINFALRRVRGLEGVIRWRTNEGTPTADDQIVTLTRNGELQHEFQLGRDGRFYLENIAPGDYTGVIQTGLRSCSFAMTVPDTQEIVFNLPGDLVCETSP